MKLHTYILSDESPQLNQTLKYAFDHPYSLISPSTALLPSTSSLSPSLINSCLEGQELPTCVLIYNAGIEWQTLLSVLRERQVAPQVEVVTYDNKSWQVSDEVTIGQDTGTADFNLQKQLTVSLQIRLSSKVPVRFYLLPDPVQKSEPLGPSVHHIFKVVHLLSCYYSLDRQAEEVGLVQDPLCARFHSYLYSEQVRKVCLIVRAEGARHQHILQQVGPITTPHSWLEKEEYRQIKKEIYNLSQTHAQLTRHSKRQKQSLVATVNELATLAGLAPFKYEDLSLDTLKKLKGEALSDKAIAVTELESCLKAVQLRREQLRVRKESLQLEKQELEEQKGAQLLELKGEILKMQTMLSQGAKSSGCDNIYQREKRHYPQLSSTVGKNENKIENSKASHSNLACLFRKAEKQKKKATVVEGEAEMKAGRVRKEREEAFLKVDFAVEKELAAKLGQVRRGMDAIHKLVSYGEDDVFLQEADGQ